MVPKYCMTSGKSSDARVVLHQVDMSPCSTCIGWMVVPVASPSHFMTRVSDVAFLLNS